MASKKLGRPSKITDDTVRKLEDAFKHGATVTEACLVSDISRETFYSYYRDSKDFSDKIDAARYWLLRIAKQNIAKSIISGDIKDSVWLIERQGKIPDGPIGEELQDFDSQEENQELAKKALDDYVKLQIMRHERKRNHEIGVKTEV